MEELYYKSPFNFKKFFEIKEHEKSSLKASISNFLHIILSTYMGECDFDENFGNSIWDIDFSNLDSKNKLRVNIADALTETVETYEKRLKSIDIKVFINQKQILDNGYATRNLKKQVSVLIQGVIKKTDEPFSYVEDFYIAPLSY